MEDPISSIDEKADAGRALRPCGHALLLVLLLATFGCSKQHEVSRTDEVDGFLKAHWARPLPAQGVPSSQFSALEASLDPRSCGTCHSAQFDDWNKSLHSRAMGPGVLGQLVEMSPDATEEHQDCLRCHAPLKEQADSLVAAATPLRAIAPRATDGPALHEQGLTCAACHVRGHLRYGPPRKDGSAPDATARLPHGGWVAHAAFEDSRFCASCHQFPKDGFALNGKLLENTYEEWKESRYAREGKTCQSCHMPERRHLWRGIHDAQTVQAAVTIDATAPHMDGGIVSAKLSIGNTGTGHYFPTYVTPKVVAEGFQENARGEMLPVTRREYVIARQVSPDLAAEIADTRVAPDKQAVFDYRAGLHSGAVSLVLRVRVEPDAFYSELYRSLLQANPAANGNHLIAAALAQSLASHYVLYTQRQKLPSS